MPLPLPLPLPLLLLLLPLLTLAVQTPCHRPLLHRFHHSQLFANSSLVECLLLNLTAATTATFRLPPLSPFGKISLSVHLSFDPPTIRTRRPHPLLLLHPHSRRPNLSFPIAPSLSHRFIASSASDAVYDLFSYNAWLEHASLTLPHPPDDLAITVFNTAPPEPALPSPLPRLLATISLRLLVHDSVPPPSCAGYVSDAPCSARGTCQPASTSLAPPVCKCRPGAIGPFCAQNLLPFKTNEVHNESLIVQTPPRFRLRQTEAYTVIVPPFQIRYVGIDIPNSANYTFRVRLIQGVSLASDPQLPRGQVFIHHDFPSSSSDYTPLRLPTLNLTSEKFSELEKNKPLQFQTKTNFLVPYSTSVVLALYANASLTKKPLSAVFLVWLPSCIECNSNVSSQQRFLPHAMLPVCLSLIVFAAVAVVLVFWLDRRASVGKLADRLSETELARMYPSFQATQNSDYCPICITPIRSGDFLRSLVCAHRFHAECVDPWLRNNRASCPTCRTDVRIPHLSDSRRAHIYYAITACLAALPCSAQGPASPESSEVESNTPSAPSDRPFTPPRQRSSARVTQSNTPRSLSSAHNSSDGTSMRTALDIPLPQLSTHEATDER